MDERIKDAISKWINEKKLNLFEKRIFRPVCRQQDLQDSPSIHIVFVIDVEGFFNDKEHSQPVKLHYERCINIINTNVTQQDIDNLEQELKLLTDDAYASFENTLNSCPQPIYTSDILQMKD